jgi:ABC-2 type transport system ATP-binding protein
MIHVTNLTKYYGDYPAIQNLNFEVPAGKVVGFLGPNGAGKTTTMRILAGSQAATSGRAVINNHDVFWNPVAARRCIGYMPENCPLYPEMRVQEYLRFRARIKGLPSGKQRQRVEHVLERCWLTDVRRQLIGTLSKGYRQRVGLADALVAEPPVLILDEPTAGLDPTQIRSTRALIRELGRQHTILLSTHILSEVEVACDSAIIIHKGRVAAQGSLAELASQAGEQASLTVRVEGEVDGAAARDLPGVADVQAHRDNGCTRLRFTAPDLEELAPRVCALAAQRGWRVHELKQERQTLEDLFVRITGGV